MRPIIKVWPLPQLGETDYQMLLRKIVEALQRFPHLGVHDENDILVQMSADLMKLGVGDEVVVECLIPGLNHPDHDIHKICDSVHTAVKDFFAKIGTKRPKITTVPVVMISQITY